MTHSFMKNIEAKQRKNYIQLQVSIDIKGKQIKKEYTFITTFLN